MNGTAAVTQESRGARKPPEARPVPVKVGLAALGLLCVALGAIGAVVPGMPTTVFLVMASWAFTRSCPWLERKLVYNRFFAPFTKYLRPGAVMPLRAKVFALVLMWASIAASIALAEIPSPAVWWMRGTTVALGLVGTWFILRWRRGAVGSAQATSEAESKPLHGGVRPAGVLASHDRAA